MAEEKKNKGGRPRGSGRTYKGEATKDVKSGTALSRHEEALEGVRRAAASGKPGHLEASKQLFWSKMAGIPTDRERAEGVKESTVNNLRANDHATPCVGPGCANEVMSDVVCPSCWDKGVR